MINKDPARLGSCGKVLPCRAARMSNWLFTQWAQVDPPPPPPAGQIPQRFEIITSEKRRVSRWAESEPDSARALGDEPAESRRKFALAGVLDGVAASDPSTAATLALDLPPAGRGAKRWKRGIPAGRVGLPSAISWAKGLSNNNDRQRAIQSISHWWAQSDPAGAAAYADSLPPGNARNSLAGAVASQWANTDRDAAVAWASALPAGQTRNSACKASSEHRPGKSQCRIRPRQSSGLLATQPWIISGFMHQWTAEDAARR